MKYTKIPTDTFRNIQLNAGILVETFVPTTGEIGRILGATTGGVNFTDSTSYLDFGEDIDNCPKNTMELKQLESHEVKMAGTFVTLDAKTGKWLAGAADIDGEDDTHIIPRNDLLLTDFKTLWWVGDYSDKNSEENAGFIAIKMFNALNTGGFQIQSSDKAKGQFAFEFTGHYSISAQDVVPYEIYIRKAQDQGETFNVIQNLTNVTSTYTESTITEGDYLSLRLTAEAGYELGEVKVEMNGVDITSTSYDNAGNVRINEVVGDVIITATAE